MVVELDDHIERVITNASTLLAACWAIDEWLHETEFYDYMPATIQHQYTQALKEAAGAFGSLRAAQYQRR